MAFSSNGSFTRSIPQDVVAYKVAKNEHCYRGAFAGVNPGNYAKAFVAGDRLVGVFMQEFQADTTDGARSLRGNESNPGFTEVEIATGGDFEFTLSGATIADIGKEVYATDDGTVALTGHPFALVGKIVQLMGTNLVRVRMKLPFEIPTGRGSSVLAFQGNENIVATGATAGSFELNGWRVLSALGLGWTPATGEDGALDGEFDNPSEAAYASAFTPASFPVDKGITLECELVVTAHSGSGSDFDWGFATLLNTTNSIPDIDHTDVVNLAAFHMDGGSDNILAQSDNNVTDVAPVDTTIDNDASTDTFKRYVVIVRPSGAVEFWVNGSRVLESTTFAVDPTASLCAFINAEKTSTATAKYQIRNVRAAGGRAFV